ncbi:MAG TPA: alpha/beta fold hydrolase [Jiangellaceae bacterium]
MTSTAAVPVRNSTTVRPISQTARLTALRSTFAFLDRAAPAISGRLATRIWCTLPNSRGARRDDRPIPGLTAPPNEVSTVTLPGNRQVAVESWGEGPRVYLVHGWGGWRGQLGAFVEPLAARGHQVVAFDAPSHGESSPGRQGPRRSTGLEMMEALQAVVGAYGPPAAIVAHSLGAATTAWSIRDGLAAPERLALIAPTVGPVPYIRAMARMLGFTDRTRNAMINRFEAMFGRPIGDFDVLTVGAGMPPTLIIHDQRDKEVAFGEAEQIAAAWPSSQLVSTDGLGHQRILRDSSVVSKVVDYVTT